MYLEVVPLGEHTLAGLTGFAREAETAGLDALGFPLGGPLEPTTVLPALAVSTSRIGLIADVSPSYAEPYNVARYLATLDHVSRGRAGWRLVATDPAALGELHGVAPPTPQRRRARAAEYAALLPRLWDSWDDDAIPADRERGVYVDEMKIRETRWEGVEFRVRGPLNVPRSPQGHPVLAVEVTDAATVDLAARAGDLAVLAAPTRAAAGALLADLRAAGAPEGTPRAILSLPGEPTAVQLVGLRGAGFDGVRLELDRAGLDRFVARVLPALDPRPAAAGTTFRQRLGLPRPADRSGEGAAA